MNAPELPPLRLTSFSHGGGCGCKIAPAVLSEILAKSGPSVLPPQLLVGIETSDDAAVWQVSDDLAVIATTDFFMPMVDDPRDFGRIAATNAISDIYAMGGRPIMALAILGMPIDTLPAATIRAILQGGASICAEAGIPVAGGHSIDSPEPIYGDVYLPRKFKIALTWPGDNNIDVLANDVGIVPILRDGSVAACRRTATPVVGPCRRS